MSSNNEANGDEDWLEAEERDRQEIYDDANADNWKYE